MAAINIPPVSHAARPRHRNDASPIAGEQLVQLDQLTRDADQTRSENVARNEVHHGQKQQGLVRRAVPRSGGPHRLRRRRFLIIRFS